MVLGVNVQVLTFTFQMGNFKRFMILINHSFTKLSNNKMAFSISEDLTILIEFFDIFYTFLEIIRFPEICIY